MTMLNNFFYQKGEKGEFEAIDGCIRVSQKYKTGQFVKLESLDGICGVYSVVSTDGVSITLDESLNGIFEGVVYSLNVPKAFTQLHEEIEKFKINNKVSTFTSESFGGYSYSKATNGNGKPLGWQDVYADELKYYKRIYDGKRHVPVINSGSQIDKVKMVQISDDEYIKWD